MLDIETLGDAPNGALAAIGACPFDLERGEVGEPVEIFVDVEDAERRGMKVGASTVRWWLNQDPAAIAHTFRPKSKLRRLDIALMELMNVTTEWQQLHGVWCNAPTFDFVILRTAFRLIDRECPWSRRQERDQRTLHALAAASVSVQRPPAKRESLAHSAGMDALFQAQLACDAWVTLHEYRHEAERAILRLPAPPPEIGEGPDERVGYALELIRRTSA